MTLNANRFVDQLESDLEIMVYVDKELDEDETADLGDILETTAGIQSVEYIPRDEALEGLEDKFRSEKYTLRDTVGKDNPLPDSFSVKAEQPHEVVKIAKEIEKMPGVYKVNYGKEMVERLFSVTKWVRIISMVLILLLALAAVF